MDGGDGDGICGLVAQADNDHNKFFFSNDFFLSNYLFKNIQRAGVGVAMAVLVLPWCDGGVGVAVVRWRCWCCRGAMAVLVRCWCCV